MRKAELTIKNEGVAPATSSDLVEMKSGNTLKKELSSNRFDQFTDKKVLSNTRESIDEHAYGGAYESLLFAGKTLINWTDIICYNTSVAKWARIVLNNNLKPNTKYLIRILGKPVDARFVVTETTSTTLDGQFLNAYTYEEVSTFTTTSNNRPYFMIHVNDGGKTDIVTSEELEALKIMILEYQEGIEEWEIPYFSGICSVENATLINHGQNLFNGKERIWYINDDGTIPTDTSWKDWITNDYIPVKECTSYYSNVTHNKSFYFYDKDKKFLQAFHNVSQAGVTSPAGSRYLLMKIATFKQTGQKVSIYEGEYVKSDYTPYKSNTLSLPDNVALRSVNGNADTYNALTGEYVKVNNFIILNGEESGWCHQSNSGDNYTIRNHDDIYIPYEQNVISYPYMAKKIDWTHANEGLYLYGNGVYFTIAKNKLSTISVEGVKAYLREHPLQIQYSTLTPEVSVLKPSNLSPVAYKEGGVVLEKDNTKASLTPEVSYSLPASKGGVISTTAKTIVKQERRIAQFERLVLRESLMMDYRLALSTFEKL